MVWCTGCITDTAFANPGTNPPPSPTAVAVISSVVQNAVQLWLNQANVTAGSTNLISTPFTANSSGIDKVLDQTTIDLGTGEIDHLQRNSYPNLRTDRRHRVHEPRYHHVKRHGKQFEHPTVP